MKRFFSERLGKWYDPIFSYSAVRDMASALFLSGNALGRYSFIPLFPSDFLFQTADSSSGLEEVLSLWKRKQHEYDLSSLKHWSLPYTGGINGVISYEYSHFFDAGIFETDHLKSLGALGVWFWSDIFLAFDHLDQSVFVAGWASSQSKFQNDYELVQVKLQSDPLDWKDIHDPDFTPNISKQDYLHSFRHCQDEIERGNSFQINISQGFSGNTSDDPLDIFAHAWKKNPAPMMCFFEWEESSSTTEIPVKKSIVSCSPERLFSADKNGLLQTQPIAGTRPRGNSDAEDFDFEHQLNTSVKEQSEHAMLVDLHRNDFGKVSEYGSVRVDDFARIEKYATVMHLVSDISGRLDSQKTAFDALQACFPGGSITGAPKHETMKILESIEESHRGFYCGSAGYVGIGGSADFNILIRTLEYENGKISGRAGGGIVFGADGESEYEETLSKWSGVEKIFV